MKRAAALLALALSACTTGHVMRSNDTLVIGEQQEPISLNPMLENGQRSTQWGELLFSYLVKYDDHGRLVPDAATRVPTLGNGGISRDGMTITYHLRPNIRFADGVRLTARDCVWSIDAVNDLDNNVQSRYGYDRIARAVAPNGTTLVLHLKRPFAPLISIVLAPEGYPIFPEHILAKFPNINHIDFDERPLGSGPYVVEYWDHGNDVAMRANPYYFGGPPAISHLIVRFIPDPTEGTNQLATGEIQAYFNEQDYSQYPLLLGLHGYNIRDWPLGAIGALIFNTKGPYTYDARVRRALAEAIDIHSLVAKAYRGALQSRHAARGLFLWAYDAKAFPDVPYDPADARRLLQAAGWSIGPGGERVKDGHPLDVLLIIQAGVPGEEIAGSDVAQYERAVGVHVSLRAYNVTQFGAPAEMGGPVYAGKFDMALYSFVNGDDPDPTDQFACANVPPHGYNKSRICDPRIDVLLTEGRRIYDQTKRAAIYHKLEALLYQELPIVPIYQRRELDAFTDRLRGPTGSVDSVFWDVDRWRLVSSPPSMGKGDVSRSLTTSSKTDD